MIYKARNIKSFGKYQSFVVYKQGKGYEHKIGGGYDIEKFSFVNNRQLYIIVY